MPRPTASAAAALAAAVLIAAPATVRSADAPPAAVTRAVEALAPEASPVPGGFHFSVEEVAVSVLADEGAGLLRVVARAGGMSEREVGLVVSALGPEMAPDLGARVVSVRGLVGAAVLAPLRGVTEGILRRAVDAAVTLAREAARTLPPATPAAAAPAADLLGGTAGQEERLPNLPAHAAPALR